MGLFKSFASTCSKSVVQHALVRQSYLLYGKSIYKKKSKVMEFGPRTCCRGECPVSR